MFVLEVILFNLLAHNFKLVLFTQAISLRIYVMRSLRYEVLQLGTCSAYSLLVIVYSRSQANVHKFRQYQ